MDTLEMRLEGESVIVLAMADEALEGLGGVVKVVFVNMG
jgi:hypothetical protein